MEKDLNITQGEIAYLSSVVYFGLAFSSLFVSSMMLKF